MFMTCKKLEAEQKKDLDYKIQMAAEAIGKGLSVCRHRAAIAFSGGKDSTVLWHLIRTRFPEQAGRIAIIYGITGANRHIPLRQVRWFGMTEERHQPLPALSKEAKGIETD